MIGKRVARWCRMIRKCLYRDKIQNRKQQFMVFCHKLYSRKILIISCQKQIVICNINQKCANQVNCIAFCHDAAGPISPRGQNIKMQTCWYLILFYLAILNFRKIYSAGNDDTAAMISLRFWLIKKINHNKMHFNQTLFMISTVISMGYCKKDVTPLLTHWSYIFLAITHWFVKLVPSLINSLRPSDAYMRQ